MVMLPDEFVPGNNYSIARLQEALQSGEAIAFVGAGASVPLYPLWAELIDYLINEAERRGVADESTLAFWNKQKKTHPHAVADLVGNSLGTGVFRDLMKSIFGTPLGGRQDRWTDVHEALLRAPFQGYVTTNFDPCLREIRASLKAGPGATEFSVWSDSSAVQEWMTGSILRKELAPILYLHGVHDRPDTILLANADYRRAYLGNPLRELLRKLWRQHILVFVGFGFSDTWMDHLVHEVIGTNLSGDRQHFAFISLDSNREYSKDHRRYFKEIYHVEPIFYPRREGNDHSALGRLINTLGTGRSGGIGPHLPTRLIIESPSVVDFRPFIAPQGDGSWIESPIAITVPLHYRLGDGSRDIFVRGEKIFLRNFAIDHVMNALYFVDQHPDNLGKWLGVKGPAHGRHIHDRQGNMEEVLFHNTGAPCWREFCEWLERGEASEIVFTVHIEGDTDTYLMEGAIGTEPARRQIVATRDRLSRLPFSLSLAVRGCKINPIGSTGPVGQSDKGKERL